MALHLVLELEVSEHSGNLLITQILPLLPRSAGIRVLVVDPKICISKRPHDQVGEPLFENILCFECAAHQRKVYHLELMIQIGPQSLCFLSICSLVLSWSAYSAKALIDALLWL